MTRLSPLPPQFTGRAFRVSDALASGVPRSRLRAADLITPARGVRAPKPSPPATIEDVEPDDARVDREQKRQWRDTRAELVQRAGLLAPALLPGQFVSHETALAAIGAPMPAWPYEPDIHISAHRPDGMPRRSGVSGHRLKARNPAFRTIASMPCEHPARAWRQTGTLWSLDDLVAAGDFLVCPRNRLITIDDLRAEVRSMGDVAGGVLASALDLLRVGAESPEETRLRLAVLRAGLPEPKINWTLSTSAGGEVARLDLAYPRFKVGAEYDGRVHAEDVEQFRRDADRWDAIRAQGWQHVRILSHHMRPHDAVAVAKITDALLAAGWRPGVA